MDALNGAEPLLMLLNQQAEKGVQAQAGAIDLGRGLIQRETGRLPHSGAREIMSGAPGTR